VEWEGGQRCEQGLQQQEGGAQGGGHLGGGIQGRSTGANAGQGQGGDSSSSSSSSSSFELAIPLDICRWGAESVDECDSLVCGRHSKPLEMGVFIR